MLRSAQLINVVGASSFSAIKVRVVRGKKMGGFGEFGVLGVSSREGSAWALCRLITKFFSEVSDILGRKLSISAFLLIRNEVEDRKSAKRRNAFMHDVLLRGFPSVNL
jgi:hypothetical protein